MSGCAFAHPLFAYKYKKITHIPFLQKIYLHL